ncbi:MAG: MATE family efflux transporter [Paludibacteraceae bacterium]|nr:MATE family efflux transporter [Paludibacteraceae bacterium]
MDEERRETVIERERNEGNSPDALGKESVAKLLINYSVPAIIAMMASSLYNVIDRIFIGQGVGSMAIAGLAITFPLMNLGAAFGAMVGAGGSALISIKLGQNDRDGATYVLGNVVVLNLILGFLLTAFGLLFLDPLLRLFGASDMTLPYAHDFMTIILAGNVVTHLYLGLNSVLRSSGNPRKAMNATLLTVAINLVLAPLFIFVFGWGIRGAALATVLAQIVALIWVSLLLSSKDSYIRFRRGIFRLKKNIVFGIVSIGISPFVVNACACLVVIVINLQLQKYGGMSEIPNGGDVAIGAFGIVSAFTMLFVMLVMGISQGMQPIAGYNYGAQKYDRMIEVFKYAAIYATVATAIATLLCVLLPDTIASLFTTDEALRKMASRALLLVNIVFWVAGFAMIAGTFFQSIGKAGKAAFISATRQMIFLIPSLFVFPLFWGLDGVWYAMPFSDVLATITAVILYAVQLKDFRRMITVKPQSK